MSKKNLDKNGRFRNKIVAFRMSDDEYSLLERYVAISGMTKQDYLINNMLNNKIEIYGNPRVFVKLKEEMKCIIDELERIENGEELNSEFKKYIMHLSDLYFKLNGING